MQPPSEAGAQQLNVRIKVGVTRTFLYPNYSAKQNKWEKSKVSLLATPGMRKRKKNPKTGRQEYKNEGKPQGMLLGEDGKRYGRVPICERYLGNATEVISSIRRQD